MYVVKGSGSEICFIEVQDVPLLDLPGAQSEARLLHSWDFTLRERMPSHNSCSFLITIKRKLKD